MKGIFLSFFVSTLLIANNSNETLSEALVSKNYLEDLNFYGAGEKVSDFSYSGIGIKYNSDYKELILEKSDNFKRVSLIQRIDINNKIYTKVGLACLMKEEIISNISKNITQTTTGTALGYGDDINYNLEFGYIENKLTNTGFGNTTTKTLYTESVLKYDIGNYGSVDGTLSYQNTSANDNTSADYNASLGYYPAENNRLWAKYNSNQHENNNYRIISGINYKFDDFTNLIAGSFSPYISISSNIAKNTEVSFDYKEGIANRSLKIREKFEEQINTTNTIAANIKPEEFEEITIF